MMRILLLIYFATVTSLALAQEESYNDQSVSIPPSPDVASIGKYGEYPINEASGTPDITIPVYHIKSGQLDLPISISYHPSGIKVTEQSSWVGLGWTLNAGGVIGRTMNGLPDEGPDGYLGSWDQIKDFEEGLDGWDQDSYYKLWQMAKGSIDGEPDIFNFNYTNQSGSFILLPEGETLLMPYKPLKVELRNELKYLGPGSEFDVVDIDCPREKWYSQIHHIETKYSKNCQQLDGSEIDSVFSVIPTFIITDENGTINQFRQPEWTKVQVEFEDQEYYSSWYLTEMISADKLDTIKFQYKENTQTINYTPNYGETIKRENSIHSNPSPIPSYSQVIVKEPAVLEKIIFKGGEVNFISYNDRNDIDNSSRLSRIEVVTEDNSILKQFEFINNKYFSSTEVGDESAPTGLGIYSPDYYRLKLEELHESGKGKYIFDYNQRMLPQKKSRNQDHWGYYNGKMNNSLIPLTNYNGLETGSADRSSNNDAMKACSLNKITYPTGGFTEFDFEANKFIYTTSNSDEIDVVQNFSLSGVPTDQQSFTLLEKNWPAPYICNTDDTCELNYNSTVDLKVEFVTKADANGLPSPYVKIPRMRLYKESNVLANIVYNDNYTSYYDEFTEEYHHIYEQQLYVPDMSINSYNLELTTSGEGNSIKATLTATGTYQEENIITVPIGGLRIAEIRHYDKIGHLARSESYEYPTAVINSGLNFLTHYKDIYNSIYLRAFPESIDLKGDAQNPLACTRVTKPYIVVKDTPFANLSGGSAVSYGNVTKYFHSNMDNTNGKIISYFRLSNDELINSYPYPPASSKSWNRGQIKRRQVYDDNDILVSEDITSYDPEFIKSSYGLKVGFSEDFVYERCIEDYDLSDFIISKYNINSYWLKKTGTESIDYKNGLTRKLEEEYTYSLHGQLSTKSLKINDNDLLVNEYTYALDYPTILPDGEESIINQAGIIDMVDKHIINKVIESRTIKVSNNGSNVINAVAKEFENGKPVKVFKMPLIEPIAIQDFKKSELNGFDSKYELNTTVLYENGNVSEVRTNDGIERAYIFNSNKQVSSEAINAVSSNIAFTSFESDTNGNWNFSGDPTTELFRSGIKSYNVLGGIDKRVSIDHSYYLEYWLHSSFSSAPSLQVSAEANVEYIEEGSRMQLDWKFYKLKISNTTNIGLSGNGIIDDLRLYPCNAQMTSYIYKPLVGINAVIDPNGTTSYYKYDSNGRLSQIKDDRGNVLKKLEYKYSSK